MMPPRTWTAEVQRTDHEAALDDLGRLYQLQARLWRAQPAGLQLALSRLQGRIEAAQLQCDITGRRMQRSRPRRRNG